MLSNNSKINNLMYESAIEKLSKLKNITIEESKSEIASMSFGNYLKLLEAPTNIVPPSGKPVVQGAPTTNAPPPAPNTRPPQNIQPVQSVRPGQPQPQTAVQPAQNAQANQVAPNTNTSNDPNALPGNAGQALQGASEGIDTVPNPTNKQQGTSRVANQNRRQTDAVYAPYNTGPQTPIHNKPGHGGFNLDQMTQMMGDPEIVRMKQLAGIVEDASCGASSAGAIATVPAPLGKIKRRNPVEESPSLEHPVAGRKSVVGATGPQASPSGKLSANLAARNKPTASRTNNGFKK